MDTQRGSPRGLHSHIGLLDRKPMPSLAILHFKARTHFLSKRCVPDGNPCSHRKISEAEAIRKLIDRGINPLSQDLQWGPATVGQDQRFRAGTRTVQICTKSYISPLISEAIKIFRKSIFKLILTSFRFSFSSIMTVQWTIPRLLIWCHQSWLIIPWQPCQGNKVGGSWIIHVQQSWQKVPQGDGGSW